MSTKISVIQYFSKSQSKFWHEKVKHLPTSPSVFFSAMSYGYNL
ncbi:MAG: hypothetical protein AABX38_00725 [Candidatus Micrarchaeota archaeon]